MHELDDNALLREFSEHRSEPAFAELVARHINKIYSIALRHTGNPHSAEEITQSVFVILAQKAEKLHRHAVLSGWLYQTARLTAVTFIRSNIRRAQREQEVLMQNLSDESAADPWPHIAPLLDNAMAALSEGDRHAVVLRYFDGKSLKEVGEVLGSSENAAKMRVNRAVEKLRTFFSKRGLALTAAAFVGVISANSVQAAPVGLAAKISLAAVTGSATTTVTALVKATMKTITWNKIKPWMIAGTAAIFAAGAITLLAQNPGKEVAQIPYKMLDDACRFEKSINQTNLVFRITIESNNKVVQPSAIHLTIQSPSQGNIVLKLGSKGEFLNFPDDDDLRQENPPVVSDQPKGSLDSGYWIYVPVPESLTFPYSHLVNAVDEANKATDRANQKIKSDYDGLSPFSGKVNGVGLVFHKTSAGKAKITIQTAEGIKEYIADSHGIIELKINPKLQAENPMITVSERPEWIGIGTM